MPDIVKIAGDHILIYEAYYKQLDPKETNEIGALDAAKFLKRSGLSDVVLSRIWDLSDPTGKGFLTKEGFFVALKLIGLAQEGLEFAIKNIYTELSKPPKVGDLPKVPAQVKLLPVESTDWSMRPEKRQQYEQLFDSLGPQNGLLPGAKVRNTLMNSKLPVDTLGRIWDLADQDRDGSLDKHEFCVAMHLVYEALDKRAIPAMLPPQLQRNYTAPAPAPSTNGNGFDAFGSGSDGFVAIFPTDIAPPPPIVPPLPAALLNRPPSVVGGAIPPLIGGPPGVPPLIPASGPIEVTSWVVSPLERCKYEEIFNNSDTDRDGLVSGLEIKDVFLQSGVAQNKLAHIWALCDTHQSGKLKLEEFCLAMWFVDRAKKGIDPPQSLAPNMVPPSLRKSSIVQEPPQPTYSNPELEMISKEIEELARERRLLEQEVAQKEADVRIKSGELRSLQSELDTLTATLKQLENQKGEAQKRLDDLKNQVNKIRDQCQKQEAALKEQEGELDSRRSELQKLKDEEQALEKEYHASTKEVDQLTSQLQDTQLEISQVKAMVTQIQEYQRQMTDALSMFRTAIEENDPILVSDYSLKIEPEFREAKQALEEKEVENANKRDPFGDNKANGFGTSAAEAGFGDDFKTNGFATQFDTPSNATGGFGDDGFGAFDHTSGARTNVNAAADPFAASAADPFGERKGSGVETAAKDEFGCDPFAILHAPAPGQALTPSPSRSGPPPRPESPSPALPPKKAKQPPPRPAPPRPMQGPTPTKPAPPASDAFGDSSGGGSFANFADFDNKNLKPVTSTATVTPVSSSLASMSAPSFGSNRSLKGVTTSTPPQIPPFATITIEAPTPPAPVAAQRMITPVSPPATAPTPVVDFSDDPFKDYRYEDPFNIEDPFADSEDSAAPISDDPFASEANVLNNNNLVKDFDAKFSKSSHTSMEELDELFRSTRISGDGGNETGFSTFNNSTLSSSTLNKTIASGTQLTMKSADTKNNTSSDPFDAFNDNFTKNTNQTNDHRVEGGSTGAATGLFDAFGADVSNGNDGKSSSHSTDSSAFFDAFRPSVTTDAKTASSASFKSFEDEFSKMDAANLVNNNIGSNSTNVFEAKFDDAFSGSFAAPAKNGDSGQARYAASTLPAPPGGKLKHGHTSSNGSGSATGSLKKSFALDATAAAASNPRPVERFTGDYSKGDTFDSDLKAALERSLVEK
ncbi:epidermal growth factor receptor substrate 15-like 1 isoform X2 [Anopheles aquasalis]|uniref:epidermal growth factor receptor substrate 15-like 1 isoform X2 n=1 Tax=Anopheles aquasalis TaxID=42839 RepID=UPI00215B3818|nr:epidermal growth factor receptor substrate 15-like 1 isoform X2 [Anopheles aquasalis]